MQRIWFIHSAQVPDLWQVFIASVPVYKWTSLWAHSSILSNTLVWLTYAVISGIVKQHCLPHIFPEQRTRAGQLVGSFPASLFWYFYLRFSVYKVRKKIILVIWRSESDDDVIQQCIVLLNTLVSLFLHTHTYTPWPKLTPLCVCFSAQKLDVQQLSDSMQLGNNSETKISLPKNLALSIWISY